MAKKKTSLADAAKRLTSKETDTKQGSSAKSKSSSGSSSSGSSKSRSSKNSSTKASSTKASTTKKSPAKKETTSAPAKKSAAKKTPAKTPAKSTTTNKAPAKSGQSEKRKEIIGEVIEIAEGLDDSSLALLLEQAKVVRYKGQIEEFNRQLNSAASRAAQARREASRPDYSVAIERNEDDFFIIQMDSARIFFNIQEMRELTKVCHRAKDEYAGARLLFRWFDKERSDLLADTGINTERSPYLYQLYDLIVNTYKVKS